MDAKLLERIQQERRDNAAKFAFPEAIIEACKHGEGGICETCALDAVEAQRRYCEQPMECGHPLACNDLAEDDTTPLCLACEAIKDARVAALEEAAKVAEVVAGGPPIAAAIRRLK